MLIDHIALLFCWSGAVSEVSLDEAAPRTPCVRPWVDCKMLAVDMEAAALVCGSMDGGGSTGFGLAPGAWSVTRLRAQVAEVLAGRE